MSRPVPDLLEAEGRVEDYLRLADKAMQDGKFDKAAVYVGLACAWQVERERAEKRVG